MNEYIEIGEIVRAHGINGELKIRKLTSDPERFKSIKLVYIDGRPYKIVSMRESGDFVFMRFLGCNDRNSAEALKNKYISIDRINAKALDEGEYFIADLIGCVITDECGNKLGKVTDISSFGAADVIEAIGEKGVFRFPFLNRLVLKIDTEAMIFSVKRDEFESVVVYED